MFHNTYQAGFLSILYSIGSKPLQIWDSKVQNGHIQRITDEDIQSSVLEVVGTNVSTNYIHCPGDPKKTLGIRLPYLVLILKNLDKYFTFEVQVLDDKNIRRRFRASTFQSCTRVKPFICTMPMCLDEGWNQIQFNLADFTRRAYGTNYVETLRVQVHANCRLRRIYFSDRLYSEEELPPSFKVFLPVRNQHPPPQHHALAAAAAAREPTVHKRSGAARVSRKQEAASAPAAAELGKEEFEREQGQEEGEEEMKAMEVTEAMAAALISGDGGGEGDAATVLAGHVVVEEEQPITTAPVDAEQAIITTASAATEEGQGQEEDSGVPVVDKEGEGSPAVEGEAPVGAI